MWSCLRIQRLKETDFLDLQLSRIMNSLPKTDAESYLKRNLEYESILCNSTELSVHWTCREFQNQTILFLRKIKCLI